MSACLGRAQDTASVPQVLDRSLDYLQDESRTNIYLNHPERIPQTQDRNVRKFISQATAHAIDPLSTHVARPTIRKSKSAAVTSTLTSQTTGYPYLLQPHNDSVLSTEAQPVLWPADLFSLELHDMSPEVDPPAYTSQPETSPGGTEGQVSSFRRPSITDDQCSILEDPIVDNYQQKGRTVSRTGGELFPRVSHIRSIPSRTNNHHRIPLVLRNHHLTCKALTRGEEHLSRSHHQVRSSRSRRRER